MRKHPPQFKRHCVLIAVFAVFAILSHMFPVWNYLYDNGKYIAYEYTWTLTVPDKNGNPVLVTLVLPQEWIHIAWTPLYIFAKEVRQDSNSLFGSFGNVSHTITMLTNIFSFASASVSALRSMMTFSYLFDRGWFSFGSFDFRSVRPF